MCLCLCVREREIDNEMGNSEEKDNVQNNIFI